MDHEANDRESLNDRGRPNMPLQRTPAVIFGVVAVIAILSVIGYTVHRTTNFYGDPVQYQTRRAKPTGYQKPFTPTHTTNPHHALFYNLPDDTNAKNLRFDDDDTNTVQEIQAAARSVMPDFDIVKLKGGPLNNRLFVVNKDLRSFPVDAVSNAANEEGLGGGGVDGAIHDGFPDGVLKSYIIANLPIWQIGKYCPTGSARLLVAPTGTDRNKVFNKKIKVILQAVGPRDDNREQLLRQVYWNILEKCKQYGIRHVVIPPISTGIYAGAANDLPQTAGWVLDTIKTWMKANPDSRLLVVLTVTRGDLRDRYLNLARKHFATLHLDDYPVISY